MTSKFFSAVPQCIFFALNMGAHIDYVIKFSLAFQQHYKTLHSSKISFKGISLFWLPTLLVLSRTPESLDQMLLFQQIVVISNKAAVVKHLALV